MRLFGPFEIIGVIFVILKLVGVIAWSWWWVCSPFLIALALGAIVGLIAAGTGLAQGKSPEETQRDIMNGLMK